MAKAGLKFGANYPQATMTISLMRDDVEIDSFEIPIGELARTFGTALGLASKAYDFNRQANPQTVQQPAADQFTSVRCSGWNVGPGATEDTLSLIFYFGEVVLGIQVPQGQARLLGQRILTAAAGGSAQ